MNATVVIITHPGAQDILNRNWPYLQVCGPPIVVEHDDKPPMMFPSPPAEVWRIGTDPGKQTLGTLGRFISVIESFQADGAETDLWIVEADTILLRPPPTVEWICGTLAGHGDPVGPNMTFHGRHYYHCPWGFNVNAIPPFLALSRRMLNSGLFEHCFIDRFLGLYADLCPNAVFHGLAWSRNTAELQDVEMIRAMVANGAWAVHGVKTQEVLEAITQRR